jgi:ATP-dependent helicase/nuclease subunit A
MNDAEIRQAAIEDLNHHIFLSAGAGTGKTRVLVERYLNVLRQRRAEVSEMVAVTFTEKAANEMKSRLRIEMPTLQPHVSDWQRHLRALENAPISTIHSFCARILREHAIVAGVDPQFAVLDEVDAVILLEETLDEFMRHRLREDNEAALLTLVRAWGFSPTWSLLRERMSDYEQALPCLEVMPSEKQSLLNAWRAAVENEQRECLHALLNDARWTEALDVLRSIQPRNPNDAAAQQRARILECAARASDETLSITERAQAVLEIYGNAKRNVGQQKNWRSKEDLAAVREAFKPLRALSEQLVKQVGSDRNPNVDERAADLSIAFAQELRHALSAYNRAKRERSVLDFSDLQILVRNLLRDHPDVREPYQQRFKFIMVDEFQDTNALQKEMIWMLAGTKGLGLRVEGSPTMDAQPSTLLFIVGDIKQGIYRFRGADVSVFNETAREFQRDPQCRVLELTTNFRTQHSLVEFFNEVFAHPAVMGGSEGKALYEASYAPMTAHRADESDGAHVEWLLVKKSEDAEEEQNAEALREVEANAIAQRITELVNAGANYGDIALLFAAMTDVAIYENALRRHDVPYYIVAGSSFYRQQEIKDVLNFLNVLENAHDEIALVGVLRSPFFAVSDETLYWLCHPRERGSLYERMVNDSTIPPEEQDKLRRAAQLVASLREVKNRLRLSQLLNLILERTGYTAVLLTQFMGEQMASNVRKLVDMARAFEVGNGRRAVPSLQNFIAHIGEFIRAEMRESEAATQEEESNVVKLLTIHRAKGLEWSTVFVPDLARQRRPVSATVLAHPRLGFAAQVENDEGKLTPPSIAQVIRKEENRMDIAEHRRLLYVALTRARDRLILSSPFKLQKDTWLQWLNEALGGFEEMGKRGNGEMGKSVVVRWFDEKPEVERLNVPTFERPNVSMATTVDEDKLLRQVQPIPVDVASKRSFSVEELSAYVWCPQKYFLAHVRQLPEEMGKWGNTAQYEELVRFLVGQVCRHHTKDVEPLVRACLHQKALVADDALVEHLQRIVHLFLQSDLWRRLSGMSLQSNVPFYLKCDDAVIEGVIDLLGVDEEGGVHVAQCKLASPRHPADATAHRFEIGLLCDAVNAVRSGDFSRSASLYYFEDGREESVDPSAAHPAPENLIAQIRRAAFDRRADAPCAACGHDGACGQRDGLL